MIPVFFRWQLARWIRAHPGRTGIVVIALLPLVYLAPLDRIPSFVDWRQGATAASLITGVVLTAICVRDSARVPDAGVWLFQKGIRMQDAFLSRWAIDMAFVFIACAWGSTGLVAGSLLYDAFNLEWVLQVHAATLLVALLAGVLLFGTSAAGSTRGGDVLALLLFVSLLEPLGGLFLSSAGRDIAHAFLLPVIETAALPRRLHDAPADGLHAAVHFTAWCTAWIAFGVWRLSGWRPLPGLH